MDERKTHSLRRIAMLSRITLTVQMMNHARRDALNGQSAAKTLSEANVSRPSAAPSPAPMPSNGRITWSAAEHVAAAKMQPTLRREQALLSQN
jgi:hypothetical protein